MQGVLFVFAEAVDLVVDAQPWGVVQLELAQHIEPGMPVYEGVIIGEHNRPNDLDVNCTREKKLTNIRATGRDENVTLPPPHLHTIATKAEGRPGPVRSAAAQLGG